MKKGTNPNFMNGVPELLILTLLSREEMYGYQLVKAIKASTRENIALGEGVVYPILHTLQKQSFLKVKETSVNGRSRRYYRLTPKGMSRLKYLQGEWNSITEAIQTVLDISNKEKTHV